MKKYQKQGDNMINRLGREIELVKLADQIAEARLVNGVDRVPYSIETVLDALRPLVEYMDDASAYCALVSHRPQL